MNVKEEKWLTPKEIEKILRLSHGTVYKMLRTDSIPTIQVGKSIRVKEKDFEEFLRTYKNKKFEI